MGSSDSEEMCRQMFQNLVEQVIFPTGNFYTLAWPYSKGQGTMVSNYWRINMYVGLNAQ